LIAIDDGNERINVGLLLRLRSSSDLVGRGSESSGNYGFELEISHYVCVYLHSITANLNATPISTGQDKAQTLSLSP
jgi:hypothetical protein